MLNNLWNWIKLFFASLSRHQWLENYFLYFAILGGVAILVLLVLIIFRINKDIKRMDKKSKQKTIDYMRQTSKHNKPSRKQLKF